MASALVLWSYLIIICWQRSVNDDKSLDVEVIWSKELLEREKMRDLNRKFKNREVWNNNSWHGFFCRKFCSTRLYLTSFSRMDQRSPQFLTDAVCNLYRTKGYSSTPPPSCLPSIHKYVPFDKTRAHTICRFQERSQQVGQKSEVKQI